MCSLCMYKAYGIKYGEGESKYATRFEKIPSCASKLNFCEEISIT